MIEKSGFTHTLKFGKRKLQIQTTYDAAEHRAIVTISDAGQILDKREYRFDKSVKDAPLDQQIRQCHDLVLADLDLLHATISNVQTTQDTSSYARLGSLLQQRGFYDEAMEVISGLHALDDQYENSRFLLGKAQVGKGLYEEAIKNLQLATEKTPDYPDVLFWLSRAHYQQANYTQAIQLVRSALEINPEYYEARFNLALYLIESAVADPKNVDLPTPIERIKEARTCLLQAAEFSAAYDRRAVDSVVELLEDLDHWPQAVAALKDINQLRVSTSQSQITDNDFYLRFMFAAAKEKHWGLRPA